MLPCARNTFMFRRSGMTLIGPVVLPAIVILTSDFKGWSVSSQVHPEIGPAACPVSSPRDLQASLDFELLAFLGGQGPDLGNEKLGPRSTYVRDLQIGPIDRETAIFA